MKTAQRTPGAKQIARLLCAVLLFFASPAKAEPVSMKLDDLGRGMYRLEGRLTLDSKPELVWGVLSDYKNIHKFVSSLKRSEVKEAGEGRVLLEQEAVGRVFIFSRRITVLLEIKETPMTRIDFEDISRKDFTYYAGSWQLNPTAGGIEVVYRLDCQRSFMAPNFVAKDAMQKGAEALLSDVRQEIVRRSAQQSPA